MFISFIFWRCPRCKTRLPMRFDIENNVDEAGCPYCGMNFLYDEGDD
jgi:DNA-directed RNA polymerase subunit RPC12/RpoP